MTFRLKRRAAPRAWKLARKGTKWVKRPAPGPHRQDASIPLLLVLRDVRRVVRSAREARILLREGVVRVDGRVVKDMARGLGLMDALSLAPPLNAHLRTLIDRRGKLVFLPVSEKEAAVKLARVRGKTTVRGGRVELTLHDGRNLLVDARSPYKVGDTLQIEVPSQKVLQHLPLKAGQLAYVSGGSHVGELARVERIEVKNSPQPNRVHFKEGFATIKPYVFVVGETTPLLALPEELHR